MDLVATLQAEIVKAQGNLNEVSFKVNGKEFTFYFRYFTLLERVRVDQMSTKLETTIGTDGSTTNKHVKQEHLVPISVIIEKSLDVDGRRLFSHTNPDHFKLISDLPASLSSNIAYQYSLDIFGTMDMSKEEKDK